VTPDHAAVLLGLRVGASREEVQAAYRAIASSLDARVAAEQDVEVRTRLTGEREQVELARLALVGSEVAAPPARASDPGLSVSEYCLGMVGLVVLGTVIITGYGYAFPLPTLEPLQSAILLGTHGAQRLVAYGLIGLVVQAVLGRWWEGAGGVAVAVLIVGTFFFSPNELDKRSVGALVSFAFMAGLVLGLGLWLLTTLGIVESGDP
jgi:hypothetical protein